MSGYWLGIDLMRTRFKALLLLSVLLLSSCGKKESKLYGTWERDNQRTVALLNEVEGLTDLQRVNLTKLFSNDARITYSPDGRAEMTLGEYELEGPDGKPIVMVAQVIEFEFKIESESETEIFTTQSSDDPLLNRLLQLGGGEAVHFESSDAYSTSLDNTMEAKGMREYWRRIK